MFQARPVDTESLPEGLLREPDPEMDRATVLPGSTEGHVAPSFFVLLTFEEELDASLAGRLRRGLEQDGWTTIPGETTFFQTVFANSSGSARQVALNSVSVVSAEQGIEVTPTIRWSVGRSPVRDGCRGHLGPYRIVRQLGEGRTGVVFEAEHEGLARKTALKVVSRSDACTPAQLEREARLSKALRHPNTAALYEYGCTEPGKAFYAMELVDGVTLEQLVFEQGPFATSRALPVLRQIAASLAHAHRAGVLHRDLQPSNVMLCRHGGHLDHVKVLDFGIAMGVEDEGCARSPFRAPEAFGAPPEDVCPVADVYSVGATAYFLLTGVTPRELGDNHEERTGSPSPPSNRSPHQLPPELDELVLACLSTDESERPQDGAALFRRLSRCTDRSA